MPFIIVGRSPGGAGAASFHLLMETGDKLLQENASFIDTEAGTAPISGFSALTGASAIGTDQVPIVHGGATDSITLAELLTALRAAGMQG